MEIDQIVRLVTEYSVWKLERAIQDETDTLNKRGYELTSISTNWTNSNSNSCAAFLVFTKKMQ